MRKGWRGRSGRVPGKVAGSQLECWAPLLALNLKMDDFGPFSHLSNGDCSNSEGVAVKSSSYWLMPHILSRCREPGASQSGAANRHQKDLEADEAEAAR